MVGLAAGSTTAVLAQETTQTRSAVIAQEQAEKAKTLRPHQLNKGEQLMNKAEDILVNGGLHWHPFFENAYSGGRLHARRRLHASRQPVQPGGCAWQLLDPRLQASRGGIHRAPRLFHRRATLSRPWWMARRDTGRLLRHRDGHLEDDRTNYAFEQPYGSALFTIWPARKLLVLRGAWKCRGGR